MNFFNKFALAGMLVVSGALPLSNIVNAEIITANSGAESCGYNFDNYSNFSTWNIRNHNADYEIQIDRITFYDEAGVPDRVYSATEWNIPTGVYGIAINGFLGLQQTDKYVSQGIVFDTWASGDTMPKRGQVKFEWSTVGTTTENILPLGLNHVRTKKALTKQGKLVGLGTFRSDCRIVELEKYETP